MSTGVSDKAKHQEPGRVVGSARKQKQAAQIKVAIVHDWFVGWGAESVVEQLHILYPDAPIYTSYCNDEWRNRLNGKVVTGYLQKWPFPALRKFIPYLRGLWFSHLDLSGYDLVISSSGAEAKFIKVKPGTIHIAYIHAPTHYYWSRYNDYLKHPGFGFFDPLARLGLKVLIGPMRKWDFRAAQRPDYLIANSEYTKSQIKKYYKREANVIHPPVDVERFSKVKSKIPRSGFVIAGRMTPYKRFDLAITACNKLSLPLTVIGTGPDSKKLRSIAGPTITFTGRLPAKQVAENIASAQAFIFPGVDDFGIVAVEALAAGTPVIAYGKGGALDYVNSKTGLLFKEQTINSLAEALNKISSVKFSSDSIKAKANGFKASEFRRHFSEYVKKATAAS